MEKNKVHIRKAVASDCPALLGLVRELAAYERAPEQVTVSLEHFADSGFGNAPVWWAFVAACNGSIVAFALYYTRYSTWKGQRMYLEDIIVTQQWRRRGIGGLLMDALIAEARDKNLNGISWQVLDWNQPAIDFYDRYAARYDEQWLNASIDL